MISFFTLANFLIKSAMYLCLISFIHNIIVDIKVL